MEIADIYRSAPSWSHRRSILNWVLVDAKVRPNARLDGVTKDRVFFELLQDLFPELDFKVKQHAFRPPPSIDPNRTLRRYEECFVIRADNEEALQLYEGKDSTQLRARDKQYQTGLLLGYLQPAVVDLRTLKYNLVLRVMPDFIPVFNQKVDSQVDFAQVTELLDSAKLAIKQYIPHLDVFMQTETSVGVV